MMAEQEQSPQEIFEAAFQDLALNQLITRNPEIADRVATMKILDADPETNTATGTFIIDVNGEEIHVPAILADNELMPFDSMYVVSMDMMLPLTPEWLSEVETTDMSDFGEPAKPPESMTTDADIRNVVVPPTTGRYSYASAGKMLPAYLASASNQVKQAFVDTLQKFPHIAKRACDVYGVNTLAAAVTPHASAMKTASSTTEVSFVTMETPAAEMNTLFGDRTPDAMREIAQKGYSVNDQRPDPSRLLSTERPLDLEVPGSPGFYRIFMTDGRERKALVFPNVLTCDKLRYGKRGRTSAPYGRHEQYNETMRVGITEDGAMFSSVKDFVAQHLDVSEHPEGLVRRITKPQQGTPRNGQRGIFFNPNHKNMVALEPLKIDLVRNSGDTRYIYGKLYNGDRVLIMQIKDSPMSSPRVFTGEKGLHGRDSWESVPYSFQTKAERREREPYGVSVTIVVPYNWRFVPVDRVLDPKEVLKDPEAVTAMYYDAFSLSGAERIRLKNASQGEFFIDDQYLSKTAAVQYVVHRYDAHIGDAEELVKTAEERGVATAFALSRGVMTKFAARQKLAQDPGMMGPPEGMDPAAAGMPPEGMDPAAAGMPPEGMDPSMMDPSMMGMDPSMMAPPPPSPVEIAAQEVAQELMTQHDMLMQEIMQEQQNVQTQMGAIQAVVQRAGEIAAEMGLPTPEMPMMEMPPEMGMDPMADPAMMGGPPVPEGAEGMAVEDPMMMESAMGLEDPELFDAAALASIASSNDFDSTVSNFTPGLRDTLDAVGRMLTEVRMKTPELRESLGEQTYQQIRDQLESLFKDLGESLTSLNSVSVAQPQREAVAA
jgi:hypothetical protein